LSNKYLGTNLKNIYEGIPTQQLGYTRDYAFFRKTTLSGYEKATNLLKDYGWTSAQARATLRYTAPRVYEQYLNKGVINIQGQKATAYFENLVKRPVITVDKNLGIKTRGGATLKDITKVQRQLVKDAITGKTYAKYKSTRVSGFVDSKGNFKDWKEFEFTSGKTLVKASDLKKGVEYLGKIKGVDVYDTNALYREYFAISRQNALKINIGKYRGDIKIKVDYDPYSAKVDKSHQILYDKIIDLDSKNRWIRPTGIKKTPFSKTFGSDKDIVADTMGKPSSTVKQIMAKIDKIDDFSGGGGTASIREQSKYWGTGQYERTDVMGALSQKELVQQQALLRSPVASPQMRVAEIKNLIQIKNLDTFANVKIGSLLAVGTKAGLKTDLKMDNVLKTDLKMDNLLKSDLKMDSMLKSDQLTQLKTSTALKTQLKSLLDVGISPLNINTPTFRTPREFTPKTPIPEPFVIPFLKAEISKRSGKGKGKQFNELAYLPDFTTRALGLEAETVSEKQAKKKLKQLLTGLEIRRGVKVKW